MFVLQQLLGFMYGWLTFYHQGYEVAKEFRPYMTDLQVRLQKVGIIVFKNLFFFLLVKFGIFFQFLDSREFQYDSRRGRVSYAQDVGGA